MCVFLENCPNAHILFFFLLRFFIVFGVLGLVIKTAERCIFVSRVEPKSLVTDHLQVRKIT